jgi:thiosulfate/3-mercaptopyruvate sulfurtransferase
LLQKHLIFQRRNDPLLVQVVDGRPKGRFDGTAPEPNRSIHSGHILGSTNVPFTQLIDPDTKRLKSKKGIRKGWLGWTQI